MAENKPSSTAVTSIVFIFKMTLVFQMFCIDFIAGGIAGATSRTCVSPFERLKIIFQVNNDNGIASSLFSSCKMVKISEYLGH